MNLPTALVGVCATWMILTLSAHAAPFEGSAADAPAGPGADAGTQGGPAGQPSGIATGQPTAPGGAVALVAAEDLAGHDVFSRDGARVGTLGYVSVGLDDGEISHLVVEAIDQGDQPAAQDHQGQSDGRGQGEEQGAGATHGELMIVPWRAASIDVAALALEPGGAGTGSAQPGGPPAIVLDATVEQLMNAPRVSRDELATLAQSTIESHVGDFWLPASELAALEGQADQQPPAGQAQGETRQSQGAPPDAPEGQQGTQPQSDEPRAQRDELVLVGREIVVTVAAPVLPLAETVRGTTVHDLDGNEIGEVTRVMIDVEAGFAAFAVVQGEGRYRGDLPVPLQALRWTGDDMALLTVDTARLREDQGLVDQDRVERRRLAELYQRFEARPYWDIGSAGGR
jgi:sporulation protein YlmC with PRC-barrel domain